MARIDNRSYREMKEDERRNEEETVETYLLETDSRTELDIRYTKIRVAKEEARNYPRIINHDLN
jgi:hypothetical protein